MIRDGQRRAEWVEKILPYAREHGAEVSTFSLSFSNQRSQTNIISLKHDSEHKISSLSPDLRSSGNMLGRIHGSQTLFLWRVQSRREDWVFLKCKCTSSTTNNKWHFLSLLFATEDSQKTSVSWNDFVFYFVATGASFHPATSFVAEKLMQEKLYEVSFVALAGRGDVHTMLKCRSSFVTSWSSCLLIIILWKNSSSAMLHECHLTVRSCH